MRTIFAEYNPGRNSIDVYTSADYMLRIDCWEAEKNLRTTPGLDCALNTLDIIVMFKKSSLRNAQELFYMQTSIYLCCLHQLRTESAS